MPLNAQIMNECRQKMGKCIEAFRTEISRIRSGRASPALLEGIRVSCYGSEMQVNQLASISVPEGRTLVVSPWDKSTLADIEKAIQKSDLGLNPINDGKVVRINLPALTEERRKDLARQLRKMAEESRVSVRNVRRDANEMIKKQQKSSEISEDEQRNAELEIQKATDDFIKQVDQILARKEKEILEV